MLGDVIDTNAAFISRELAALGIGVYKRLTVGDNPERLKSAFRQAFESADMVVATGGLGPTADDITKEAAAECLGLSLILDENILNGIKAFFKERGVSMPENNIKQAHIPAGAEVLENDNGTAPGVYVEKDGKILAMLPGPPVEMEQMFRNRLRPLLARRQDGVLLSKTIKMCGIGESSMETFVRDMLDQQNPTVAPYAGSFEVRLRITAKAASETEAKNMIEPVRAELYNRLSKYIYGEDDDSLESVSLKLLKEKNLRLALAESCTGGALAARITNIPGSSEVFLESAVTYSNDAKINRLGVNPATLEKHGAVSRETAMEMAKGTALSSKADIGLAITGIAGPGGATPDKPVGLVYIALYNQGELSCEELRWSGSRERVRARAVAKSLEILWRALI